MKTKQIKALPEKRTYQFIGSELRTSSLVVPFFVSNALAQRRKVEPGYPQPEAGHNLSKSREVRTVPVSSGRATEGININSMGDSARSHAYSEVRLGKRTNLRLSPYNSISRSNRFPVLSLKRSMENEVSICYPHGKREICNKIPQPLLKLTIDHLQVSTSYCRSYIQKRFLSYSRNYVDALAQGCFVSSLSLVE